MKGDRPLVGCAERDEPRDASDGAGLAEKRPRHEPPHAVGDDVDLRRAGLEADPLDRLPELVGAPPDVAPDRGVADAVEMEPAVPTQAPDEPEEVRGMLGVAVQQDDGPAGIATLARTDALATEREGERQGEERGHGALDAERPEPADDACGPRDPLVVVNGRGVAPSATGERGAAVGRARSWPCTKHTEYGSTCQEAALLFGEAPPKR